MIGKVLFVTEQFYGGNPEWGPSNIEVVLVETLVDSGLAHEISQFYYDQLSKQVGSFMGEVLVETCAGYKPDLVIFFPMGLLGIDPPRTAMGVISNTLGIKVLLMRGDSIGPEGHRFNTTWFPFVDYIAFLDSSLGHLGYGQEAKAVQAIQSFNARYFYDKKLERDIDVSFVGSVGDWPKRAEYIGFLRQHGVGVVARGGQRFDRLGWGEYSDIINRSKISLNFCLNGSGYTQIKGRVFEVTSCRTLLIEDEGIETKDFFDEGKDFVMCRGKEEMLEKVKYYLAHDSEREAIAESGYRKVTELYNSKNVWAYMLNKIGFSITGDEHWGQLYSKLEALR